MNEESLNKPEVNAFVEFYMISGRSLVREVGYVALEDDAYVEGLATVQATAAE